MQIGDGSLYFVLLTMNRFGYQISLIFIILVLASCHRPPEFPDNPVISFERLHLTDTSTLILDFKFRDGNGDVGLEPDDLLEPYHPMSFILQNDTLVNLSGDFEGPFDAVPGAFLTRNFSLFKGLDEAGEQIWETESRVVPLLETSSTFFSANDSRPSAGYSCQEYEIVSDYAVLRTIEGEFIVFEELVELVDTIFVERNPFHFNINIDLLVKSGSDYIRYQEFAPELISECDPLFTSRFPIFDRSDIGRPLDGTISYAFFSTQFATENSILLQETLRLRFSIYDRALNQSNTVETEDFTILGLRSGDLVGN